MRRFPEALQLVETLNDKAASEDSSVTRGILSATRSDNTFFSIEN